MSRTVLSCGSRRSSCTTATPIGPVRTAAFPSRRMTAQSSSRTCCTRKGWRTTSRQCSGLCRVSGAAIPEAMDRVAPLLRPRRAVEIKSADPSGWRLEGAQSTGTQVRSRRNIDATGLAGSYTEYHEVYAAARPLSRTTTRGVSPVLFPGPGDHQLFNPRWDTLLARLEVT